MSTSACMLSNSHGISLYFIPCLDFSGKLKIWLPKSTRDPFKLGLYRFQSWGTLDYPGYQLPRRCMVSIWNALYSRKHEHNYQLQGRLAIMTSTWGTDQGAMAIQLGPLVHCHWTIELTRMGNLRKRVSQKGLHSCLSLSIYGPGESNFIFKFFFI